jgi:formate dehydrogenase gamma subunit
MVRVTMSRPLSYEFAVLAVLVFLAFPARLQGQEGDPNQACHDCHAEPSMFEGMDNAASYVVVPEVFAASVHGSFACADCHQDLAGVTDFPHPEKLMPVDCGTCHDDVQEVFHTSLHWYAKQRGNARAPDCRSCHGAHDILPGSDERARTHKPNIPAMCATCHGEAGLLTDQLVRMARTVDTYAASVHGRAQRMGKENAAVCTDCHGVHDLKGRADPGSTVYPINVSATCGKCHLDVQRDYDRSIHGRALQAGIADSPTCNDCHGEHLVLSPRDRNARTFAARLARETCGGCHEDSRIIAKYGLADYVVETYVDSYHGWASLSAAEDVATCVDCHTAHWVLPERDPSSTISPGRVVETCRQCHAGATPAFAASYTHRTASIAANPGVGWVRGIYWVMIATIIGGMVIHNLVIFSYYLVLKRQAEKAEPSLLRMDRIQLVQHMVLAIVFTGLVITGFALRFPESWWVGQLNNLGMTEAIRSWIHRVLAVILLLVGFTHVLYITLHRRGRREFAAMLPRWKDVREFVATVRYYTWNRSEEVPVGRYDYTQKAEYWALVWGTVIMAITGLVLWYPAIAVRLLPSWTVLISQTIHYYEAWLATLAIIVWHFFFTILHPKVYPMSWTWITGRMPEREAREHHPEWYREEISETQPAESREPEDDSR